jgi:hypothetical protein
MWGNVRNLGTDPLAMQDWINEARLGNRHRARILANGFAKGSLSAEVEKIYEACIDECWDKVTEKGDTLLVSQIEIDRAFNLIE